MRRITAYGLFTAAWMSQLLGPTLALNDTINVTVGTGTTKTANLIAFGGGNVISEVGICDATTANQCAVVSAAGAVKVDGSAVTQPISAASLPLPAGAATLAGLTTINTTLGSPFQAGASIGNTSFAATQATGSNLHMVCDSGCSGSGGTSSAFAAAFPANGTAIGLTNGTNMVPWSATTNYGTAPAAIAVPAVNAFITGAVGLADASTSSGQTFSKIGANAVSSAPTYTNGNTYAVTQTLGGALNVADAALLAAINNPIPLGTGATGGWTPLKLAALTNTAVAIKASAGQLSKLYCYNPNSSVAYIQVYNVAAGSVTVGTTAALQSYGVPPTSSAGFIMPVVGDQYVTAISAAATTTAGGATAPSTAIDCNASYN